MATEPITQDTALNELQSNSPERPIPVQTSKLTVEEQARLAPSYAGGWYGEQLEESGGGYDPTAPDTSTKTEVSRLNQDYNIAPSYAGGWYGDQVEESGGGWDPTSAQTGSSGGGWDPTSAQTNNQTDAANPDATTITLSPLPNPLHAYPSYTYSVSLHLLTKDEYNNVVKSQKYTPNRVLIASAGRYNNTPGTASSFIRAPYFSEDFYFDNLNIFTTIGGTEHSRATNAAKFEFDIIEPYGMTLVNRIMQLCASDGIDAPNYTDMPYVLQIDFFAIDDAGNIVGTVPNQTKVFPITINRMDIKTNQNGSEYHIVASPCGHTAYNVNNVSTPAHFEVVAGTVASFFQSTESESFLKSANQERESSRTEYNLTSTGQMIGRDGQPVPIPLTAVPQNIVNLVSADPIYRVKSYGSAYNAWMEDTVRNNKRTVADKIFFKFHEDIGKANFKLSAAASPKSTPMTEASGVKAHFKGDVGIEVSSLDYSTKIFSINTGTSIEMLLNYVIRNSSYIQDQLVVPEDFGNDTEAYQAKKKSKEGEPLNWFKIVPTVILGEFDNVSMMWAREITYHVIPYPIYNAALSVAPQGRVSRSNAVKSYNYYYTGKNIDILEFNIEYNALYFNAVTAYRGYGSSTSGVPQAYEQQKTNPDAYSLAKDPYNAIMPLREIPQTLDARARSTGGEITPSAVAAVDVEQSIYTNTEGTMVRLVMKIIGDPHFIKQDDLFYAPVNVVNPGVDPVIANTPSIDPRLIADGSLHMDRGEIYAQVLFRSPSDIDESTGLMKFESQYNQSLFSGMYNILKIESHFSGGQFVQTLEMTRLPRQTAFDYVDPTNNPTNQRSDLSTTDLIPSNIPVAPNTAGGSSTPDEATDAPGSAPIEEVGDPTITQSQAQLTQVGQESPTQAISADASEIPLSPPPPPPKPPLPEGVTQNQSSGNYEFGGTTLPLSDRSRPENLKVLTNAMAAGDDITIYETDPVSGRTKLIRYDSSTNSFTTRLE